MAVVSLLYGGPPLKNRGFEILRNASWLTSRGDSQVHLTLEGLLLGPGRRRGMRAGGGLGQGSCRGRAGLANLCGGFMSKRVKTSQNESKRVKTSQNESAKSPVLGRRDEKGPTQPPPPSLSPLPLSLSLSPSLAPPIAPSLPPLPSLSLSPTSEFAVLSTHPRVVPFQPIAQN